MEPAKISTTEIKFQHIALLETMKILVHQVAALSTEVNQIKSTSQAAAAANVPAAAINHHPSMIHHNTIMNKKTQHLNIITNLQLQHIGNLLIAMNNQLTLITTAM